MKLTLGLTLAMALCATSATYPQWHEGGEPAEDTPSSRSIGDFAAMLLLSSKPNEFLEEWNRPASADFAPRMETADRVKRGDIIVAFVLFSGCSPSEDGLCDASVDFEVLRPDGAEYSTIADAELWRGKAPVPKPYLQLGTTYLGLVIEPQDPLGDYTVNVQVCDSVSDRCLDLTEQFEATHRLQEFELDEFMNSYYLDPRPDLVPRALRDLSDKGTLSDPNAKPPVLSFLAEVFSNNRERLEDWRGIIDEMEAGARGEILRAVSLSRDPKAIQTSEELSPSLNDMCWGGFFATGDTGYLQKVLDKRGPYLRPRGPAALSDRVLRHVVTLQQRSSSPPSQAVPRAHPFPGRPHNTGADRAGAGERSGPDPS